MTTKQDVLHYVEKKYGTNPDFPFHHFPTYAALRHGAGGSWYGLLMDVPREKIGLSGEGTVALLDVKIKPEEITHLLDQQGFVPAYHMNKDHWISIILDGSISETLTRELLDESYDLTR